MWFCEGCERNLKNNSKSSHFKSTAHLKKIITFRINNDPTYKNYVFDYPNVYQFDYIIEEASDDCMQYFLDLVVILNAK